jgi:hypothetical protein
VTRVLALLVRAELTEAFVSVAEEVVAEAGPVDEDKMALLGCTEQPAVKGLHGLGSCRLTDRKVRVVAAVAAVVVVVHAGLEDNHFLTLFQLATYSYPTGFVHRQEQRRESGSLQPWQRWPQQWMTVLDLAEVAVVR